MVLNLDLEKAYDRVYWHFIDKFLERKSLGGGGVDLWLPYVSGFMWWLMISLRIV